MRGDSLRDLYAKTLALFGLALLAGVGALVDYWPAPGALPAVASAGIGPTPAPLPSIASLGAALTATVPSPAPRAVRDAIAVTPHGPVRTAAVLEAPKVTKVKVILALDSLPVADALPLGEGVALGDPPLPAVTLVAATRVPAPEIALPPEPALPVGPVPPDAPLVDRSPDGFLGNATSAFKKTGESIVNTTVKTGASIIKAFGIVGGAFKKVI